MRRIRATLILMAVMACAPALGAQAPAAVSGSLIHFPHSQRTVRRAWYLAQPASENHGMVVTLDGHGRHVQVVTPDGRVIDELHWPARGAAALPLDGR